MKQSLLLVCVLLLASCASLVEKQTQSMADSLSLAIMDNDDPDVVRDGAPAFLLMLDGFIHNNPESEGLLIAGAQLNSAYASVFVGDEARKNLMHSKALDLARRALCRHDSVLCEFEGLSLPIVEEQLMELDEAKLQALYTFATSWVGWIQANSSDWLAISHIPKITSMLIAITRYQPTYKDGGAYLYLGGLSTLLPSAMGGKPEQGKAYFEQALSLSKGKNLMVKVLLAEKYARLVFDQQLHDELLSQVLEEDAKVPGYTLMNTLAKIKAQALLDSSSEYF